MAVAGMGGRGGGRGRFQEDEGLSALWLMESLRPLKGICVRGGRGPDLSTSGLIPGKHPDRKRVTGTMGSWESQEGTQRRQGCPGKPLILQQGRPCRAPDLFI